MSQQLSQILTLEKGEEKIIQSGMEQQLAENTFSVKFPSDARIIAVVKRYDGIDSKSVTETTEITIIYEDLSNGMIDVLHLPYYFSLHQYFGFKYQWDEDVLRNLRPNTIIEKDTIVGDSPTLRENNGYAYGVNANVALASFPESAEDGVIISESLAKKLGYKVFETRIVEFGTDMFPLNIYGDINNYKPFPEIGEEIGEDAVLMALREYNPELSPALTSKYDTMEYNPVFDKVIYVKKPGSKIVDIKGYYTPKPKKDSYTGTADMVMKYSNGVLRYHNRILEIYEQLRSDHYKRYKNNDLHLSEELDRLIVYSLGIVNPDKAKIKRTYKKDDLDVYRLEFTIESTLTPNYGGKLSDLSGAKGVIISILPDNQLPDGVDMIMDPKSTMSRMNIARLYEQYIMGASRETQRQVREMAMKLKPNNIPEVSYAKLTHQDRLQLFDHILGFLNIFGNEQAEIYASVRNDESKVTEIVNEALYKEIYVFYTIRNPKTAYQVVVDIENSPYRPLRKKLKIYENGEVKYSKEDILVAPLYTINLSKTADRFLAVSSSRTNHYNFPIGTSKANKELSPWLASPTKIISETESRLYASYCATARGLAELKDRATSITTHANQYLNILTAPIPTQIMNSVNRDIAPFGKDASMSIIRNTMNCAGIDIVASEES